MSINEKDRLDLRQEFERLFNNKRIAEIAMQAMPPIDYSQLATKEDLAALDARLTGDMSQLRGEFAQLRGEFAQLRGEMHGEFGKIRSEAATNLRLTIGSQFATAALIIGWVSATA